MAVMRDLPRLTPNPEFADPSSRERLVLVQQALERNGFHTLLVGSREEALRRIQEYSLPLEDSRMKSLGRPGSLIGKILIMEHERPGRVTVILLEEPIGF